MIKLTKNSGVKILSPESKLIDKLKAEGWVEIVENTKETVENTKEKKAK